MARRIAITNLNASTIDILNTIRANAPLEYQNNIPVVTSETEIPKVGEILYGYPSLANHFVNALVNRIALVKMQSATFNNPYVELKKGYIDYGETIEEIFVDIAKVQHFSYEKAPARQLKRTLPNVRSAFHAINWRVIYPVSVDDNELRRAFTTFEGVTSLIASIVDSVYRASNYDEFLLFKYLLIKSITHGKLAPVPFTVDAGSNENTLKNLAVQMRSTSNMFTFMSEKYNAYGVKTTTPKERQYLFMDAATNAAFDVEVLASAFNMDKADFIGRVKLIDDWTTFDNERWTEIMAECDGVESVTDSELALMADVKAVLLDSEFFQIYDYTNRFTENYVGAGRYWNYWYHVDKGVGASPFANAVVFVKNSADISLPDSLTLKVTGKEVTDNGDIIFTLGLNSDSATVEQRNLEFIQTADSISGGVAVHRYGAVIYPYGASAIYVSFKIGDVTYLSGSTLATTADVGDTLSCTRTDAIATTLSALSITGVTLSPSFASSTTTYTGATSTSSGTITATATDENATVVVKKNGTTVTGTTLTFSSGSGNVITVVVSGMSEGVVVTKTYTITVTYTPG